MNEEVLKVAPLDSAASKNDAESTIDLRADQILGDKYKIEEKIGSGAWGNVYRATHLRLGNKVAIKTLHFFHAKNEQALQRLEQEARSLRQIDSTFVIKTFDYGLSPTAFLVMEYFDSVPLSAKIQNTKLAEKDVLSIFEQICQGLKAAHSLGLVHRDLKPSNILLSEKDDLKVKIIDFGLAKVLDTSGAQNLTMTGEILGSPPYMAPEQWTNRSVDQRTDIYSLGCLMFEAASGKKLFEAQTSFEYLSLHVETHLYKLDPQLKIHPELTKVILKCVQNQPAERYQSVREILDDIAIIKTGGTVKVKIRKPKKKINVAAIAIGTMCALSIAGIGGLIVNRDLIIEKYCESLNNSAQKQLDNGQVERAIETYKTSIAWQSRAQNKELYRAKIELLRLLKYRNDPSLATLTQEIQAYRNPEIAASIRDKLAAADNAAKQSKLSQELTDAKAAADEARESGAPRLVYAICLDRLAKALLNNEQKLAAVDKQVEALSVTTDTLGEGDELTAKRLVLLARINFKVPNADEAEHALLRAVDIASKKKDIDTLHEAYVLLGKLAMDMKEMGKALKYFQQAVSYNGRSDVSKVEDICDLSNSYASMNDIAQAHKWARTAYELPAFKTAPANTRASLLLVLALSSLSSSRTVEGRDYLERAIALESQLPPNNRDLRVAKEALRRISSQELTTEEMAVKNGYVFLDADDSFVHGVILSPEFYVTLDPDSFANQQETESWKRWHMELAQKIFSSFLQYCNVPGQTLVKIVVVPDHKIRIEKFGRVYPCAGDMPRKGHPLKLNSDSRSQEKFKAALEQTMRNADLSSIPFPPTKSKFEAFETNLILSCDADAFPRMGAVDLEFFARRDAGANELLLYHTGVANQKFIVIQERTRAQKIYTDSIDELVKRRQSEEQGLP